MPQKVSLCNTQAGYKQLATSCMTPLREAVYGVKSDKDKFLTQLYLQ